ncbi:hypothetical protein GGR55DRAFT_635457 [Xylaria sp. FL0064]|nr:hypothetical protein GGR55DRAFT_635457 [Xylaria sp. FL0064]
MGTHYLPEVYESWQQGKKDFLSSLPDLNADAFEAETPSSRMDTNRETMNEKVPKQFEKEPQASLSSSGYVRRGVHVKVCAVWDTVAALGRVSTHMSIFRRRKSRKLSFVDSNLCDGIDYAIQALSLHEHRRPFCPIVWKLPNGSQDNVNGTARLQQCWFMGYHSDIGGGVRGEGLSHYPLAWMMSKLKQFLAFEESNFWKPRPIELKWKIDKSKDSSSTYPSVKIDVKDSMSKGYWLAGSHWRRPKLHFWVPQPERYVSTDGHESCETLHFTVRLLSDWKAMERPKTMKEAQFKLDKWDFPVLPHSPICRQLRNICCITGPVKTKNYSIEEDEIKDFERSLLIQWVRQEYTVFMEEHDDKDDRAHDRMRDYRYKALRTGVASFLVKLLAYLFLKASEGSGDVAEELSDIPI